MVTFQLIAIGVLIALNGFLAMCEMAMVSSSRGRLEQLAENGRVGARIALDLSKDPGRFLSAVQTGVTLISILAGTLSGATIADALSDWLSGFERIRPFAQPAGVALTVAAVTYFTLVIGELVPKQIALKNPEAIAASVSGIVRLITRLLTPVVWVLNASSKAVLRTFGIRAGFERRVTDEDIHALIMEAEKSGELHTFEREMVEGVLDLEDRTISTIMTPRPRVVWIDLDDPRDEIMAEVRGCPHGQLLVSRGSIDEMVGLVRKQDLLDQALDGAPLDIEKAVVAPVVIPEHVSILQALEQFRRLPVNTAVIVDEYGTIQGLVTRTDLLEAMAGDLADAPHESTNPQIVRRHDGSFLLDAALPIGEVMELLGIEEPEEESDFVTLAGFVLSELGHLPRPGENFIWTGWRFRVVRVDGQRIDRLLVQPAEKVEEKDTSG